MAGRPKSRFDKVGPMKAGGLSRGAFKNAAKVDPNWTPPGWKGSSTEWLVFRELTTTHSMKSGVDFTYQAKLTAWGAWAYGVGGRPELGGLVADFLFWNRGLVVSTLSDYFHYSDAQVIQKEKQNRIALQSWGYNVIYIDSGDMARNPQFYVNEALELRDHSKIGTGRV